MDSDGSPTGSTSPLTRISPSVGATTPDTHLISVDFPAPLGPSRQCTSPARTSKATPFRASTPGYCFEIPLTSSSGALSLILRPPLLQSTRPPSAPHVRTATPR